MSNKGDDYKRTIRRLLIGLKSLKASLTKITLWEKMDPKSRHSLESTIADAEELLERRGSRKQKRGIQDPKPKKERKKDDKEDAKSS